MAYFKRLFVYCRRYHLLIILGLFLSLSVILVGMVSPYLNKLLIDDVLINKDFARLGKLLGFLLVLTIIHAVLDYSKKYLFEYISQGFLYDLRSDLYDKLQAQSFAFYDQVRTGLLMNRMVGDVGAIRKFLNKGFIQIIEGAVSFISCIAIMLLLDVKLTLAVVMILPFHYFNTFYLAKNLRPRFKMIRTAFERLTTSVQENITGIRVVKAFGREEYEKEKFTSVAEGFRDEHISASDIRSKHNPLPPLINGIGSVIILLYGGYLAIKGEMSIGSLAAFNSYMMMLKNPVKQLNNLVNQWEDAKASLEKIFELLDEVPKIKNRDNPVILNDFRGEVEFNNVAFKYNDQFVLQEINLQLSPGKVTAIMGATGSGKSTLISLISRFYDCTQGKILVDGMEIKDLELHTLRRHIGIIPQETFLFSDTIAANIAFGKPEASSEEIEAAARLASAHDFIIALPDGYQTVVGERGVGLSGGQKQRIAIARALLFNPKILIMDSATSSLDLETEFQIQQALKKIMKDRTILIIGHRISAVKEADEIVFLDEGRIVERGNHEQLMKLEGRYYQTFLEQYHEYVKQGTKGLKKVSGGAEKIAEYI